MSRFRVWDEFNESEDHGRTVDADDADEAGELYVENMSRNESLESNEFELKVRPLDVPAALVVVVDVTVNWDPSFSGRVRP